MPRGGKRKGAGRKATWNAGSTKPIKLPELLIPEILELARMMDRGDFDIRQIESIFESSTKKLRAEIWNLEPSELEQLNQVFSKDKTNLNTAIALNRRLKQSSEPEKRTIDWVEDTVSPLLFSLTPDQQKALEKMKEFVRTDRQKYFRLTGYAGTGKSFLTVQLMKWLLNQKINFVGGSPTNKAVKNLKKLASEAQVSIEAHTVAQLLGQQPELNESTGKEEFISKGTDSIGGYQVALIDEFSMISRSNFKDINQAVWNTPTKVIFVGDAAQLPPVGESEPIIATHEYITNEATLSSIVRYDGDIAKVAEEIRSDRDYNKSLYPFKTTPDKTITCLSRDEWLKRAIAFFKSDEYIENPDHIRFLVWRNKTAASLNDYVRSQLWGENVPDYVPGDRLIAKIPVFRRIPGAKGKNKWQIVMNNSEECEITGDAVKKTQKRQAWEYWEVPAKTDDGLRLDLRILTPQSEELRQEKMTELRERKRWKQYYDTLKSFDNVPYSYAITTHKAQGSSINYIFPDIADMRPCPDLQKILYTALTRARIQAFIPY